MKQKLNKLNIFGMFLLFLLIPLSYSYEININGTNYNFTNYYLLKIDNVKSTNLNYVYTELYLDNDNFNFNNIDNCNSFYIQDENNQTALYNIDYCYTKNGKVYKSKIDIYFKNFNAYETKNYSLYFNSDFDNKNYLFKKELNISTQDLVIELKLDDDYNGSDTRLKIIGETGTNAFLKNGNEANFKNNGIFNYSVYVSSSQRLRFYNELQDLTYSNREIKNFTIIGFFKMTDYENNQVLYSIGNYDINLNQNNNQLGFFYNGNEYNLNFDVRNNLNKWNYIVIRKTDNVIEYFINNQKYTLISGINNFYPSQDIFYLNARYQTGTNSGLKNYGSQNIDEFILYNRSLSDDEILNIYEKSKKYTRDNSFFIYLYENGTKQETILKFNLLKQDNETELSLYDNLIPYYNDYAYIFVCNSIFKNKDIENYNFLYELIDELKTLREKNTGNFKCVFSRYINGKAEINLPVDLLNKDLDIYFIVGTFSINEYGIPYIQDKKLYKKIGETKLNSGYEYNIILEPDDLYPRYKVIFHKGLNYLSIIIGIVGTLIGIYLTNSILKGSLIGFILMALLKGLSGV